MTLPLEKQVEDHFEAKRPSDLRLITTEDMKIVGDWALTFVISLLLLIAFIHSLIAV